MSRYSHSTNYRGPAYWLDQQRRFMGERGVNAAGYQIHYAGHYTPEQIQAIYEADLARLRTLADQVLNACR